MPVDYKAIYDENIRRYGEDTTHLDLLGRLYSKRTHFIFELIQNAEDAGAKELTFELFDDRLEVRHDGRPFNEADVRGICGVGRSTKSEDLTQIGKFGIGFKSVYAYTRTPRIHSGDEHFRIENYVRPHADEHVPVPSGETLFVFPFDHLELTTDIAAGDISEALDSLNLRTLLFLRNIERIYICGATTRNGVLGRLVDSRTPSSRRISLTGSSDTGRWQENWIVWERKVFGPDQGEHRVEIAFRVTQDGDRERIIQCDSSPLVAFFPTEKDTSLGFLIQGPYRTTPARDNIPDYEPWNKRLVNETAILLTDVLTELRDKELLTVEVLQALPLEPTRFEPGSMFHPMFTTVRNAFIREKLIPLADGGYGRAPELRLARGTGIRDLLSPEQLCALYDLPAPVSFAHPSITADRSPFLWKYLREELEDR
ncbi:sacsin N-terminal ATP-binding-like domain-containing protein [Thermomonospora cellulosilytica]|uniref:Sacsin/Nov domain-containing protein n=1 Tax=Thermomonospora cellulosilytica TaxID=1411118 RepID=A0A7W3MYD2_9ACTN|nr:hypothetical protein [Thermomonospora cellulosilytica]MBA9004152.1 hypothetical protein [Thermomonospora cellulosilytica]